MRSASLDRIDTRCMDHGVGVLRGVLSKMTVASPQEVEAAIEHIRGAARLIERLQREADRHRRTKIRRRR